MPCQPLTHPPEWKAVVERAFLLGVPVIGPQEAVRRSLCAQLAPRTPECWGEWGSDERRVALARFMARELGEYCGEWPNPVFVPDDPLELVAWNPASSYIDDLGIATAIMDIERHLGIRLEDRAWEHLWRGSFGAAVNSLLARAGTPGG